MKEIPPSKKDLQENQYSLEWFKKRAINSITQIDENTWDYSDSLLLYIPNTEKEYEAMQEDDTAYHEMITGPERAYLEKIAPKVVAELPERFNYVDLGPGTEHKEQFIFDAANAQKKSFIYTPVDISEQFLKLSTEYAKKQGIETHPQQVPFEELASTLEISSIPRFISLGLTYSNYNPSYILELLKSISPNNGVYFINAQIRDRIDMEKVRKTYEEDVHSIVHSKLELLGLSAENDIKNIETDDGVRSWCTLKRSTPELESKGVHSGARLLMFQSLRYTKKNLESSIKSTCPNYQLFDTGDTFIGALIKT